MFLSIRFNKVNIKMVIRLDDSPISVAFIALLFKNLFLFVFESYLSINGDDEYELVAFARMVYFHQLHQSWPSSLLHGVL